MKICLGNPWGLFFFFAEIGAGIGGNGFCYLFYYGRFYHGLNMHEYKWGSSFFFITIVPLFLLHTSV